MKDRSGPFFELLAGLLVGAAIVVAWTGGWRIQVLGLTIGTRSVWRPLLLAVLVLAARAISAKSRLGGRVDFLDSAARVVAGALLVAGVLGWIVHRSPYLGGADSYGYVSAAERIRAGALIQREPLAAILPYPDALAPATPLGYVSAARVANASAPAYPLGLPALMAAATALAGSRAPFYVPLATGSLLLAVCYGLGRRWCPDPVVPLAVAAAIAFHPVVFAYVIQAMSDVPATAFFLLAAACLMSNRGSIAFAGGVAGGLTVLTRPALLPGVAALALVPLMSGTNRSRRITAFAIPLAIGVAAQLWSQWYLYGSALANGYGAPAELFSLRFLLPNIRSYAYWGIVMHGGIWVVALVFGLFQLRDTSARAVLSAAALAAVVPYAVYRPYDHWETLRFVLPLLVVGTIYAVVGLFTATRRAFGDQVRRWIGLTLTVLMIAFWVVWLDREHVLTLSRQEERFSQAGELVERVTPANAVVLASLHSGSLRYYARRQTLDWGKIRPGQLDVTVASLVSHGLPVFLMLDGDDERSQFEARHGRVIDDQQWLPTGQRRDVRLYESPQKPQKD